MAHNIHGMEDHEYLLDLVGRLFRIPLIYGVDGSDIDSLGAIAKAAKAEFHRHVPGMDGHDMGAARIGRRAMGILLKHDLIDATTDDEEFITQQIDTLISTSPPEGWGMMQPSYHQYPYSVEHISGKWHLRKHHGNGAAHTVSKHDDQFSAMAAHADLKEKSDV